jgi:hypothetical protein
MTLRMGDGPVGNLPDGLDAVAGYVDDSGIGETYPQVVARFPALQHLSISTHGAAADCADVENGALRSWKGYRVGYADASNCGGQIVVDGRPDRLWVAHHTGEAHICTSAACWPASPVEWVADGTQWVDHGGLWDESLLADDFFGAAPPLVAEEGDPMFLVTFPGQPDLHVTGGSAVAIVDQADLDAVMAVLKLPIVACASLAQWQGYAKLIP